MTAEIVNRELGWSLGINTAEHELDPGIMRQEIEQLRNALKGVLIATTVTADGQVAIAVPDDCPVDEYDLASYRDGDSTAHYVVRRKA